MRWLRYPEPMTDPLEDVKQFYALGREQTRLESDDNKLERARTFELLERYLPAAPATVHDIGGGPGIYALGLAARGYQVNLLDFVPLHVEQALASAQAQNLTRESATVGDARSLPYPNSSADAVLLLGPLYHLTEYADRIQALEEALRVLGPGGVLCAVSINRFSASMDGLFLERYADPEFRAASDQDLLNGQHRNPEGKSFFTTAFFHHPLELKAEVLDVGFTLEALVGIEGPGWLLHDFDTYWNNPVKREWTLHLARALEFEPTLLGVSAHVMAVGRKPA